MRRSSASITPVVSTVLAPVASAANGAAHAFSQTSTAATLTWLERGPDRFDVLFGEQQRERGFERAQLVELAVAEIVRLETLDEAIDVLAKEQQIKQTNNTALDEGAQLGCRLT